MIIGIDDTDNLESRGTGYLARCLGTSLQNAGLVALRNITRHQLLVDPRIPYTSHNSSASLFCSAIATSGQIISFCSEFLTRESASGSDAGLCVTLLDHISEEIIQWGIRAKIEVLCLEEALMIGGQSGIFLTGLTGKKNGQIGALAAVGLRAGKNDGRLLWTKNLRDLKGIFTAEELILLLEIDCVEPVNGKPIDSLDKINTGDWCRPVIKNEKIILYLDENDNGPYRWQCASKDFIKSISG